MNWLRVILYGLVSGLAEFLPVSGRAHQVLLGKLFGFDGSVPVLDLFVHLGALLAVLLYCSPMLLRLKRGQNSRRRPGSRRVHIVDYDSRLIKTAVVPLVILLALNLATAGAFNLVHLALFSVVTGVVIFISEHMRHANKDARLMTGLDGIVLGIAGGLSFLPGFSRNGAVISYATARGADRTHAINWALLLSIPALLVLIVCDFAAIFSGRAEAVSFLIVLQYILAAAGAFAGAYSGVRMLRFLAVRTVFTGFAYYCWGVSLFSLFLYLIA